jgi:hypothetical protein
MSGNKRKKGKSTQNAADNVRQSDESMAESTESSPSASPSESSGEENHISSSSRTKDGGHASKRIKSSSEKAQAEVSAVGEPQSTSATFQTASG